jgi:hypothetical protein
MKDFQAKLKQGGIIVAQVDGKNKDTRFVEISFILWWAICLVLGLVILCLILCLTISFILWWAICWVLSLVLLLFTKDKKKVKKK